METPGFSIWIVLILVAVLMISMFGALFLFLSVGTLAIAKFRPRDVEPPRPRREDEDRF